MNHHFVICHCVILCDYSELIKKPPTLIEKGTLLSCFIWNYPPCLITHILYKLIRNQLKLLLKLLLLLLLFLFLLLYAHILLNLAWKESTVTLNIQLTSSLSSEPNCFCFFSVLARNWFNSLAEVKFKLILSPFFCFFGDVARQFFPINI